jgi:predicted RNase H-like HicB family nuclease
MLFSVHQMSEIYHVHADWDPEVGVWVATSEDIPGLATEAATIEAITEKLRTIIPELLEANRLLPAAHRGAIAFELTSIAKSWSSWLREWARPSRRGSRSFIHCASPSRQRPVLQVPVVVPFDLVPLPSREAAIAVGRAAEAAGEGQEGPAEGEIEGG